MQQKVGTKKESNKYFVNFIKQKLPKRTPIPSGIKTGKYKLETEVK